MICHDPDAPLPQRFTHSTIYGIPPTVDQLAEAGGGSKFTEGTNSAELLGYPEPAPPNGHGLHHYYWLYALDRELELKPGLNRE